MSTSISMQAKAISDKYTAELKKKAVAGVNKAALYLQAQARKASPSGDSSNTIWKAIKTTLAMIFPAKASVYIDYQTNPVAVYIHERKTAITITPKQSKYLYIPVTAEGRQHTLHARDAEQKGLKGFLGQTESGRLSMFVGNVKKEGKPDYVLKKQATIPKSKYAGFLTDTAMRIKRQLIDIMRREVNYA